MANFAIIAVLAVFAVQAAFVSGSSSSLLAEVKAKSNGIAVNKHSEVNAELSNLGASLIEQAKEVAEAIYVAGASKTPVDVNDLIKNATASVDGLKQYSANTVSVLLRVGFRSLSPIYQSADKTLRKLPRALWRTAYDRLNSFYETYCGILDNVEASYNDAIEKSGAVALKAISSAASGSLDQIPAFLNEINANIALIQSQINAKIDAASSDLDPNVPESL